ncbi:hypothetical protein THRCLA_05683 [Thraustotheca clavata]|uniref:OTU domain-containing protein n=1 Tax=Thraustotheca clavata TaxID=74557 RepID=A0A1V9ZV31_9STRA|nr:hypothetical protein THRCLA_05683 [Thraustotheca clavata]
MGREGKQRKLKRAKAEQKMSKKKNLIQTNSAEIARLRQELHRLGLQLVTIDSDGNCLFRTLSDQLYGDQTHFPDIRKEIVQYIKDHQENLEPFMEDEETFDNYCRRMAEDGVWGGNLELYVAALVWKRRIVVHQVDGNRTTIDCGDPKAPEWHICYYNDEHYDSIRSADDDLTSAPLPVSLPNEDKICVEITADNGEDKALESLKKEFPQMDVDELESLYHQLNSDPARVRKKLIAKNKKSKNFQKKRR